MGGRSGAGKHKYNFLFFTLILFLYFSLTRYGNRTPSRATIYDRDRKQPSSPASSNAVSSNPADELNDLPPFMAGLEDEDFFHGLLIRNDGARMCKHDGDFLLLTNEISPASVKSVSLT